MKRLGLTFLMAVFMGASLMLLNAALAEAHTCSSVCNQIRRACLDVAKATRQVARAVCEDERDGCRANCAANAESCPGNCEAANGAGVAACNGNGECEAGCATDLAQCLDDCANCIANCNAAREVCLGEAEQRRQQAMLGCTEARAGCPDLCVEPIDPVCVGGCKSDARTCGSDAKKLEGQCKRECPNGTGRQACVRECRKQSNVGLQGCANQEILCLAACANITLP